ncbi:MAG TPA: acetylxylan esterase [Acidobacteriota bacterium]|jgi:cephalosporin-C deacetylase-like acetyl esterase
MFRRVVRFVGLTLLLVTILAAPAGGQDEDLSVVKGWVEWSGSTNQLQRHLNKIAFQLLDRRRDSIKRLSTATDWKLRQAEVRKVLESTVGPFPEKTPLNPRTLGVVRKDGYRIEKIVFESVPGFYVTSCLFIPDRLEAKAPAILNVIGHTDIAFRAPMYQELILNLVKKGFIILAMDPVGQGERLQYYDPSVKRSTVGGPTTEHTYFGRQCFVSGSSAARYFVWDGMRAIDYLVSRPEVDPIRIGVTGISGGGTQTSYIAALDDRIVAAAPTCYITSFRRLFESIGPQDAEQNLNSGVFRGIDHADFLEVRAPKPTLVVATTRDFFSIQGSRETVTEAKAAFRALGAPGNLEMVEDDFGHGYTRKTREAICAFFQKSLNNPGSAGEVSVALAPPDDLRVTSTGQVGDSLGGETVFSLNRREALKLFEKLDTSRKEPAAHLSRVRSAARQISGYREPEALSGHVFRGRHQRPGYAVEMHVIRGEGETIVPFLLMIPDAKASYPALIYLHPGGKSEGAAAGGEMEQFAKLGYAVLAPDLAATGELGSANDSVSFLGMHTGRSIAGLRAADIIRCVRYLRSRQEIDSSEIVAVSRGGMAIPLLHAAAFDESIRRIALIEPLISFRSVVLNRYYKGNFADMVANALTAYDLPDLEAALAPRRLLIVNMRDQLSSRADRSSVDQELQVVRSAYARQNAGQNVQIRDWEDSQGLGAVLSQWLGK